MPVQNQTGPNTLAPATLYIVHGVGPFDQRSVVDAVTQAAEGQRIQSVQAFNWDQHVGRPFGPGSMLLNLDVLSEISAGALNAANIGFLDGRPYAGIREPWVSLSNGISILLQLFSWMTLVGCAYFALYYATWKSVGLILITTLGLASLLVVAARTPAARVCVRRFLLTLIWPYVHALAVPLGFGLIGLVIAIAFLPLDSSLQQHGQALEAPGWLNLLTYAALFSARIIMVSIILWVSYVVYRIIATPLKIMADIFRYIGLRPYRERLLEGFAQHFRASVTGSEYVIVVAHSLGSVIAVQSLLSQPHLTRDIRRLVLITLGSPLRRFFYWFFPGIYPAPETLYQGFASQLPEFLWVNVYRPLDPIGGRVGSPESSAIVERSTRQYRKCHTNYWSDPTVKRILVRVLGSTEPHIREAAEPARPGAAFAEGSVDYPGRLAALWRRRHWPLTGIVLGSFCALVVELILISAKQNLRWETDIGFGFSAFLWVMTVLGAVALSYYLRKAWQRIGRPYVMSLYGLLSTAPVPWTTVITPPNARTPIPSLRWPWVLPLAFVILMGIAGLFVYREAQWVSVAEVYVGRDARELVLPEADRVLVTKGAFVSVVGLSSQSDQRLRFPSSVAPDNLALSPDGRLVAAVTVRSSSADAKGPICLAIAALVMDATARFEEPRWIGDCGKLEVPYEFAVSSRGVIAGAFSNAQHDKARIALWDGTAWQSVLEEVPWVVGFSHSLQFSGDGECLAWREGATLQRLCPSAQLRTSVAFTIRVMHFALGPGLIAVTSDGTPSVWVFDSTGKELSELPGTPFYGSRLDAHVAVSPDGELLAYVADGELHVWRWHERNYWAATKQLLGRAP